MSTTTTNAVSPLHKAWEVVLANIRHFNNTNPRLAKLVTVLVAALPLAPTLLNSYRGYLALGRGGLPYNIFGWMTQAVLLPFSVSDTRSTSAFSRSSVQERYAPHGTNSFLATGGPLPPRTGGRPVVPGYVAPQRQTTQESRTSVPQMDTYLAALAEVNPGVLSLKASGLESSESLALYIAPPDGKQLPSWLMTKGEIVHVHPEGSSHMILSLKDAEIAVSQGWAEQHKLSGRGLPTSYVLVYAPRDSGAELEVWQRLVGASVAFTTASWDISVKLEV